MYLFGSGIQCYRSYMTIALKIFKALFESDTQIGSSYCCGKKYEQLSPQQETKPTLRNCQG